MTYRERRLARAERLEEWADKRAEKAAELHERNKPYEGDIAFNTQPGHIPERSRAIARTERAWEHSERAASMANRADGIRAAADHAIYDDDPDAIERLREKLADLEAKRENAKQRNAAYRKEHRAELKEMSAYERGQAVPFPSYYGQNLSGLIGTTRKRIAQLEARQAHTGTTAKPKRLLSLRYAGECVTCKTEVPAGTLAYYDRSDRAVTCRSCEEGNAS
jgi:DNA repair exonuclease SbcCD ATPase subunit